MSLTLRCPCGARLRAEEKHGGKRVRCPACGKGHVLPAKAKAGYDVFISHAAEDKAVARAVCQALEAAGVRCWIAPRDILPGKDWAEVITDATDACRGMVLVYSDHANRSVHVRREVEAAVGKGAFLIPFRIEDAPMSKAMKFFLHSCQWLDALDGPVEKHVRALVPSVQALLRNNGGAPPVARRAEDEPAAGRGLRKHKTALVYGGTALAALLLLAAVLAAVLPRGAEKEDGPGAPPNAGGPPSPVPAAPGKVSEVTLRGGSFLVRAEGVDVRSFAFPTDGKDAKKEPAEARTLLLSNRPDAPARDLEGGARAVVGLLFNNQSHEDVTLARVEVIHLGLVTRFEDRIREPQPPQSVRQIPDLIVEENEPRSRPAYADLAGVFRDTNDPPSDLRYDVRSEPPGLVSGSVGAGKSLDLRFAADAAGTATVTVRATNAFELTAQASFKVTVKNGRVRNLTLPLGVGEVRNVGQPAIPGKVPPFKVEEKKLDLGTVLFSYHLGKGDFLAPAASGNLLPLDGPAQVVRANSAQPVLLRLACRTTFELPDLPKDLLEGTRGRRLAARQPHLEGTCHLLAVRVRINAEDGVQRDLYPEGFLLLYATGYEDPPEKPGGKRTARAFVSSGMDLPPDKALARLLEDGVKPHKGTLAFERAKVCGIEKPELAEQVSPFCYFGDPASPFRTPGAPGRYSDQDRWPRSNLAPALAAWRGEHAVLWGPVEAELGRLAADEKAPLQRRARFLQEELARPGPAGPAVTSTVQAAAP